MSFSAGRCDILIAAGLLRLGRSLACSGGSSASFCGSAFCARAPRGGAGAAARQLAPELRTDRRAQFCSDRRPNLHPGGRQRCGCRLDIRHKLSRRAHLVQRLRRLRPAHGRPQGQPQSQHPANECTVRAHEIDAQTTLATVVPNAAPRARSPNPVASQWIGHSTPYSLAGRLRGQRPVLFAKLYQIVHPIACTSRSV